MLDSIRFFYRPNAPRAWLCATVLPILLVACSGSSSASGTSADEFARFWADCSAYCQKQVECGLQSLAACNAYCPPAEPTKSAVANANLSADELRRCQDATRLSDTCVVGRTCQELSASPSPCEIQFMTASSACALVLSAFDLYFRDHAATPFYGPFTGSYMGSDSGTLTGNIMPWGSIGAFVSSPSLDLFDGAGTVTGDALTLSGQAASTKGSATVTFTGTIVGSSGMDAGVNAHAFSGSGNWQSSVGGSGTFEITSN